MKQTIMEKKDCTILINSCDEYSDVWDGFFYLLKKQWSNLNLDIVLNTESKQYSYDGLNIKTFSLDKEKKMPWGKRLIKTLDKIETKYILFMLDDFYLESPVNTKELNQCFNYMELDSSIAYFSFMPVKDNNNIISSKYPGYELRPQKGKYRLNCQISLWNKEYLKSYIRPHESPWEWEIWGSKRSERYKEQFYVRKAEENKVFDYKNGAVIMRGRWKNEVVQPLVEKYNLNIDMSKRESYEEWMEKQPKRKRKFFRGIKNRINIIRSLV